MDWHIQSYSKVSKSSGRPFEPGDKMVCLLHKDDAGELVRVDLHPDEVADFTPPKHLLGCWTREVKEDEAQQAKEQKMQTLASSEELFLSLFEGEGEDSERAILKQLLALMLERKRILRPVGEHRRGSVEYLHVKTKTRYVVDMQAWDPQKVIALEDQLSMLLL